MTNRRNNKPRPEQIDSGPSFLAKGEASPDGEVSDTVFILGATANQQEVLMAFDCLAEDPSRLFPSPKGSVTSRLADAPHFRQRTLRSRTSWQASQEPA